MAIKAKGSANYGPLCSSITVYGITSFT